jgi:hypothetical protein
VLRSRANPFISEERKDNVLNTSQRIADLSEGSKAESVKQLERLRQIVERHRVCYEVWPERSVADGQKIVIGFELQLCGTNSHVATKGEQPVPGCKYCCETYEDLRQIADWILPTEERPSRYEIAAFDRSLHVAPRHRHSRSEVVLTVHILHRSDFNRDVDDCENRCLREMRQKLTELGIRQDIWREENSVGKGGNDETPG